MELVSINNWFFPSICKTDLLVLSCPFHKVFEEPSHKSLCHSNYLFNNWKNYINGPLLFQMFFQFFSKSFFFFFQIGEKESFMWAIKLNVPHVAKKGRCLLNLLTEYILKVLGTWPRLLIWILLSPKLSHKYKDHICQKHDEHLGS